MPANGPHWIRFSYSFDSLYGRLLHRSFAPNLASKLFDFPLQVLQHAQEWGLTVKSGRSLSWLIAAITKGRMTIVIAETDILIESTPDRRCVVLLCVPRHRLDHGARLLHRGGRVQTLLRHDFDSGEFVPRSRDRPKAQAGSPCLVEDCSLRQVNSCP